MKFINSFSLQLTIDSNSTCKSKTGKQKKDAFETAAAEKVALHLYQRAHALDAYAIKLQAGLRGWLTRCWFRWYKGITISAVCLIQAGIRGFITRRRVSLIVLFKRAATDMQRVFRGWRARVFIHKRLRSAQQVLFCFVLIYFVLY